MVFQYHLVGVFHVFQCCFKNSLMEFPLVLKKFQWSIKGVSMVFSGCFKSYLFQTRNYLQKDSFLSLLLYVSLFLSFLLLRTGNTLGAIICRKVVLLGIHFSISFQNFRNIWKIVRLLIILGSPFFCFKIKESVNFC